MIVSVLKNVIAIFVAVGAVFVGCQHAAAETAARPALTATDSMIDSDTPGIRLFVRNKHPENMTSFSPEKTVLFVHGSTYPSETSFDLPLGGLSWMDYIAGQGYDVWLVDMRGYGRSDRPKEMSEPAETNPPIERTPEAVRDVTSAVDHILRERHIEKLNLIGWSWGTTIMGMYTAAHNDKVTKLVLYAPQWLRKEQSMTDKGGQLGAYRVVSIADTKNRWLKGVAPDKREELIPAGWFEQWSEATFKTDPWGWQQDPKKLRAPNGTVADTREFWAAGKTRYDPGEVKVPTLVIHAEWDQDNPSYLSHGIYAELKNTPWKRFVEIGEGTHTVIMEKNRMQLFREVQLFLSDPGPKQQ